MFDRFWHEIPPVTRLIMSLQIVGLALHSLGYADRYDFYFSLDKIFLEGQVLIFTLRYGALSHVSSSLKNSTSIHSSKSCFCKLNLIQLSYFEKSRKRSSQRQH